LDRVLAQQVVSQVNLPPFNNSAMDGFAVQAVDVRTALPGKPVKLEVIGDIPAGTDPTTPVLSGQAARIMTGAPLPSGADAVIPQEDIQLLDGDPPAHSYLPPAVLVQKPVNSGQFIRSTGQDIRAGQVVLEPGRRLNPQDLGLLAMVGETAIQVYEKPRIALLSSGDELIPPDQALSPGKIRDSNSIMLAAMIERDHAEAVQFGVAADRFDLVEQKFEEAVNAGVNLILTSAGVSVGAYDYVRAVVESRGALTLWRVNMRPGKPLAFGRYKDIPVIGLPGNPVSAYVGYTVFVRPVLDRLSGSKDPEEGQVHRSIRVQIDDPIESDGRESYLRARVRQEHGIWRATLTGHQGSGNLFSLVQANALLIITSGVKSLPAGSEVEAWLLEA
jgi:molybdopterin molybdotransferase